MRVYRVVYAEDCEKCEGTGTVEGKRGYPWVCGVCDGRGMVRGESELVAALRDIHERGQMPGVPKPDPVMGKWDHVW